MSSSTFSDEALQLITARGAIPLGFAEADGRVFLVARDRAAQWPVDVLRSGRAELRLPSRRVSGNARLVTEREARQQVLELFREKYGPGRFLRWYDRPARVLQIDPATACPAEREDERYERWIRSEFDNVADDYDRHITGNRINRLLRDRSLAHLRRVFRAEQHLLEIGCGSGMETIPLLREGHEVLAVDISDRMLEVVRDKARREGLSESLRTQRLRARELPQLVPVTGLGSFDGGFSTYGALNCEPDLRFLPSSLHALLGPQKSFVAGVYNRWCLFEPVAYTLRLQWRRAISRFERPIRVGASRFCVDVYAYSVPDLRSLFASAFDTLRVEAVPVLLPPSDLTGYAEKFRSRFDSLARFDAWIGIRWPWRCLGDHFLITFRKRRRFAS